MATIPLKVVNSDAHYITGLIGYTLLYSDNIRRGHWINYDDANTALLNHSTEIQSNS